MVNNNRINEEDLRETLKENARLAKQETTEMKVREAEKEQPQYWSLFRLIQGHQKLP